jgi:hypothetical protein
VHEPLADQLPQPLRSVAEARDRASGALRFLSGLRCNDMPVATSGLVLRTVHVSGRDVALRPLNAALFIEDPDDYLEAFAKLEQLVGVLARNPAAIGEIRKKAIRDDRLIARCLYTTLQSQAFAMDCLLPVNTARKNFGTRFEEFIEHLLAALGIGCKPITFALPYQADGGNIARFSNQVDLVIAEGLVDSTPARLEPDEVVVSLKTSSKDRFAKIFLDQEMLAFVTGRPVKVVALFHNDVQRSGSTKTSWTFVAGNFAAYVQRFGPLTGVYYIDPPPHIERPPWDKYLRTFDDLLLDDLWNRIF